MQEELDLKKRILTRAEEMFAQFGFSRVTMEEIACSLGMSKKTLYKCFNNKEHVLRDLIDTKKCTISETIDAILENPNDEFIVKLSKILAFVGSHAKNFNGPLVHDLMRTHPEIWNEMKEFRRKHAYERISRLISQGKDEGYIRPDIDTDLVTTIYVSAIHTVLVPDALEQIGMVPEKAYSEIMKVLFEGIFSEKGREQFQKTFRNNIEVQNA